MIAEADGIQRDWREQFKAGASPEKFFEIFRLRNILFDEASEGLHAVGFERHPHLEGAEATRKLDAAMSKWQAAGDDAAREIAEIVLLQAKGIAMGLPIAHEDATYLEGQIHPLVQVKRQGIGLLYAVHDVPQFFGEPGERAESAVHMEPETFLATKLGERAEIVGGAGIDRAGVAHNAERQHVFVAIAFYQSS